MFEIVNLLHASLMVADLAQSRRFYEDVLGLKPSPARPEMSFSGIWYDIGSAQIHLICLPNPDPVSQRPAHGGRDRHTALGVNNFDALISRLDAAGLTYSRLGIGGGGIAGLRLSSFVELINGVHRVEVSFDVLWNDRNYSYSCSLSLSPARRAGRSAYFSRP